MKLAKEGGVCALLLLLALASVDGGKKVAVTTADSTKASTVASTSASTGSTTSVSPATTSSAPIKCYVTMEHFLRSSSPISFPLAVDQASKMQLEAKKPTSKGGCYTAYTVSETTTRLNKMSQAPIPYESDEQKTEDSTLAPHLYFVSPDDTSHPLCDGTDKCEEKRVKDLILKQAGSMVLPTNKTVEFSLQFDYTFFVCCCQTNLCNNPNITINQLTREYEKHIRSDSKIDACYLNYSENGDTARIDKCGKGSMCYTQQTDVNGTIVGGCAPDDSSIADGECQKNGAEVKCFCRGKLCNSVEYMEPACRRNKDLKSGGGACAVPQTEEQTDPPTTVSTTTAGSSLILIISIVAGVVVLLILIAVCLIVGVLLWRRRKKAGGKMKDKDAVKKSMRDSKQTSTMAAAKPTAGATKPQDGVAAAVAQKPQNSKEEQIQEPEPKQEKKLEPKPKKDDALVAAADGGELMIDDLPGETKAPIVKDDVKMANTPTASSLSEASQSDETQEK